MRSLKAIRVLAAVALTLGAAGCASAAPSGSPVATDRVDLPPSYKFVPALITVKAGTTVTWTNHDNLTHSVQLDGTAAPGQVMHPGEQTTHTFATPGTYHYVCSFHANNMQGEVIVTS